MLVEIREFSVGKQGNADSQNDDWKRSYQKNGDAGQTVYLAVADGVSESVFAGRWATSLAASAHWRKLFQPRRFPVDEVVRDWLAEARLSLDDSRPTTMPWYLKAKAARGSSATFLGARIRQGDSGGAVTVDAVAIGDACAFHIAGGALAKWFPHLAFAEFGNVPDQVSSTSQALTIQPAALDRSWRLRRGETVILATDAVAQWLVGLREHGHESIGALLACHDDDAFAALIGDEREAGRMRNDDATVILATRTR